MFENLKIVELASVLAGPLTGSFFAELGAEVVKIENKLTNGDVTRKWKLPKENKAHSISAYYAAANYGKKSLLLDFTQPDDYDKVMNLVREADIVIANFKPGDAVKLKLDYETLKQTNQSLIYAEINGFGENNNRVAFDVVLQAESGFMYMNGEKNAPPLKMPVALIDILAAHQLKEGILCALIKKMKTNKGGKVSVSLYDAAISSLANQATNWLMNGEIPKPLGSQHPNIAPYGDMFYANDKKWLVLAVGSEKQFAQLCNCVKMPELAQNPLFSSNQKRVENREQLNDLLQEVIAQHVSKYWETLFTQQHIPFGIVKNMQDVFATNEARQLILHEKIEGVKTQRVKTAVFKIKE
jgi:crotonobetainyl-CoA:carnitine CoA-transferase CaiB-like acyl-CoA transferase